MLNFLNFLKHVVIESRYIYIFLFINGNIVEVSEARGMISNASHKHNL
jgi:hypothetical protein